MATSAQTLSIETGHEEMIHDAQMDFYGKRLATASSDRTIKVFDVIGDQHQLVAHLKGHDGPVWQVAWAHPKFGVVIASCSYDRKVCIWKEESPGQFNKVFEDVTAEASVNAISWAPHVFGLVLAAASADGHVTVYSYSPEQKQWQTARFLAHNGGVNAVSWGPETPAGSLVSGQPIRFLRRFVTGGCDNRIAVWAFDENKQSWEEQKSFDGGNNKHEDWVRDVAWAPSLGLPSSTIASCSEDKTVAIWTEDASGVFKRAQVLKFEHKVWRVSWSVMGNILAVSQGDQKVTLWKESLDGSWKNLSSLKDAYEGKADE